MLFGDYANDRYPTKNYSGFVAVPLHRTQMAQAAVEIIHEYHQYMNKEKMEKALSEATTVQLPMGIVVDGVDTRCLTLPFPPEAILPTMRLIFSTMNNKVRFALSDQQINSITTGPSPHIKLTT